MEKMTYDEYIIVLASVSGTIREDKAWAEKYGDPKNFWGNRITKLQSAYDKLINLSYEGLINEPRTSSKS